MLLAPDSMRLRPEDREAELQPGPPPPPPPPRESEEEDEDDPPASEAGVAHSEDERYRRWSAPPPAAGEPPVGKRPLKDPPERRVEPNMPDRVAAASLPAASLASRPASGGRGLLGLVPSRSLLKTSSPREAMRRTGCEPQLTACSHCARTTDTKILVENSLTRHN